jgi:D-3-phosphoglycerate dehydrogenase / 2-oxoglutarate reductase
MKPFAPTVVRGQAQVSDFSVLDSLDSSRDPEWPQVDSGSQWGDIPRGEERPG